MKYLTVQTLGEVSITYGEEIIEHSLSNKSIAMICLLLSSENLSIRKNKIVSLLWGDSEEEAAKYNLRYNLWSIKKIISGDDFIISEKDKIFINPLFPVKADILKIRQFNQEKNYSINELIEFKKLFKGDFLEGFYVKGCCEYSDLILIERMSCHKTQIKILEKLLGIHEKNSDFMKSVEVLEELMTIDSFNEGYANKLMRAFMAQGKNANAIKFYKSFESTLRSQLNISTSQELKTLFAKIRSEDASTVCKDSKKFLSIETYCYPELEFFWLADCVYKLNKLYIKEHFNNYLEELNKIFFHYQSKNKMDIYILNLFFNVLSKICVDIKLEIVIHDFNKMDKKSFAFFTILKSRPIDNLRFIYC